MLFDLRLDGIGVCSFAQSPAHGRGPRKGILTLLSWVSSTAQHFRDESFGDGGLSGRDSRSLDTSLNVESDSRISDTNP